MLPGSLDLSFLMNEKLGERRSQILLDQLDFCLLVYHSELSQNKVYYLIVLAFINGEANRRYLSNLDFEKY